MGNPRSDIEARVMVISGPVETESTKISLQAKTKFADSITNLLI